MNKIIPIIKPHIIRDCSLYQKLKQASEELSLAIAALDIEKAEMELERLSIDIELRQLEQDIANKVIKWDNAQGGSND